MPDLSRRNFLLLGAAAGALGIVSKIPFARAANERPHFLLAIHINSGADNTYLFDGRNAKLTEKNLKQNYLLKNDAAGAVVRPEEFTPAKIEERTISTSATNSKAIRSPMMDALWESHKDVLSIVNGIMMLPDNVGHPENTAYFLANQPRGGTPIFPPMVGKRMGGAPLDSIILRDSLPIFPGPSNLAGSAELASFEVNALSQSLQNGPQIDEESRGWKHILARSDENAAADGLFADGAKNLSQGLRRAKATGNAFANMGTSGMTTGGFGTPVPLSTGVKQALAFFSAGMTRVATIIQNENVDLHDQFSSQSGLVTTYTNLGKEIALMIELLKTTKYVDASGMQIPYIDLTTFIISSEFGRTSRSQFFTAGTSVGNTGSDHNPFSNTALVGGRGIKGGLVVGESDLRECDDNGNYLNVSNAHKMKNAALDSIMGKPFNFETQKVRDDLPQTFDQRDYINMPSVTNTILDTFGVPTDAQFKLGGAAAPLLSILRTNEA